MEKGKIGGILKEKRMALGFSLEEIERRAFLSKRYLSAIENDDISVFPKISFATSLIRQYLRFLGFSNPEIANLVREFNPKIPHKFIFFGKNSIIYIILLLILLIISIIAINL